MGYSANDIGNAAKGIVSGINDRLEARSEQRAEEIAHRIAASTSGGRGLWFIILWPAWIGIALFSSMLFGVLLGKFGLGGSGIFWGWLGGIAFAIAWYRWDFTRRHPFWNSVVGYFGTALGAVYLMDALK